MNRGGFAWPAILIAAGLTIWALAEGPAGAASGFAWRLPAGVTPPPAPADNPMSEAKVELGRRLFYDADLSVDGTTACATCHEQHRAFTEGNSTHPGVHEAPGRRNVMALANIGYLTPLTWADPWRTKLESQALVPMLGRNPVEMGMGGQTLTMLDRLKDDDCYRRMFAEAFPKEGGSIDMMTVTKSLAAFERTLLSFNSPYDRAQRGAAAGMSEAARRGQALFFAKTYNCSACHSGQNFTDATEANLVTYGAFHNIGLYDRDGHGAYPDRDHGLGELTYWPEDEGRIRTPSLRNVALTAPYMHDGSVKTLDEAVSRHFGPAQSRLRDPLLRGPAPTAADLSDLVAFLGALTDETFVTDPRLALPKTACGKAL